MSNDPGVDPREFLRHSLATLAYRAGKVVRSAPAGFATTRTASDSRSAGETLAHLCDLLDWALSQARGQEVWHDTQPGTWDDDVRRFFAALHALDEHLSEPASLSCPWTRLFQGPIADALTHVGQLAMLRRLACAAVRGENYYRAEIRTGRVGLEQEAPRREFD